uniref:DMT family transporter n=1 Tax=candidate division WOR-3 bacterium TaxID=2052148 RepID=A0A7V0Z3S8_UNCW3
MNKYFGEIAALGTSFCWAFGSVFFTIASRLIGSNEVNRIRLVLGMLFLMFTHLLLFGSIIPVNACVHHWFWFGISGLIGFTIGDTFLFRGYVLIGPRLTMLLMSLSPIFGTILAWVFLGESLNLREFLGILITITGISMVIYNKKETENKNKDFFAGIFCGFGAALCQAIGYFASKKGLLYNDFPALSGNLIRIMSGAFFIWVIALFQKQAFKTISLLSNKKADMAMLGGAIFGPFIGVWLSLIAVQHTYIGIASTLMALPPVILIPLSHWIFKERITYITLIGTFIAVSGVSLIFLR